MRPPCTTRTTLPTLPSGRLPRGRRSSPSTRPASTGSPTASPATRTTPRTSPTTSSSGSSGRCSSYTPGTFEGWLHRITTNVFLDKMRRKQRIRFDALPEDAAGRMASREPGPAQTYDDTHFDDDVQRALDALPPDFRAAVVLCDIEGLSYEEIATTLGVKLGTVRSRIHRGRAQLREALAHRAPERRHRRGPRSHPDGPAPAHRGSCPEPLGRRDATPRPAGQRVRGPTSRRVGPARLRPAPRRLPRLPPCGRRGAASARLPALRADARLLRRPALDAARAGRARAARAPGPPPARSPAPSPAGPAPRSRPASTGRARRCPPIPRAPESVRQLRVPHRPPGRRRPCTARPAARPWWPASRPAPPPRPPSASPSPARERRCGRDDRSVDTRPGVSSVSVVPAAFTGSGLGASPLRQALGRPGR